MPATGAASASGQYKAVSFGTSASDLFTMHLDGGPVTVSAPGLAISRPVVAGNVVTYANVAPGTDFGVDPLTANTYTYVNGDPINLNDPNGRMPVFPGDDGGPVVIPTLAQTNSILREQVQTQEANRAVDGGDIMGRNYIQADSIDPSVNYNEVITTTNNKTFVLTNAPSNEEESYILSQLRAQFGDTYEFAAVLKSKVVRTPDFVAIDRETGQIVRIDTTRVGSLQRLVQQQGVLTKRAGTIRKLARSNRTRFKQTLWYSIREMLDSSTDLV